MRLRLSTNHRNSSIRRSKCLKRQRKHFENEIKEIIANSLMENNNNKELVDKNITLLAEIETLKREKLDLFKSFMFKQNPNQMVIKNDLISLLESVKSDRKLMTQMFEKTNEFFNQIVDKISDQIEKVVTYEDKPIECKDKALNESCIGSDEKQLTCHQIYEMRQISRQSAQQNDCIQNNNLSLSIIPETTSEICNEVTNSSEYASAENLLQTPIRKSGKESICDYELTPHFTKSYLRTPSIYNFECNSFNALRPDIYSESEETSFLTLDESLRPELTLSDFNSFNTTVTDEQNGMTSSTPVCQMRLSLMDMIQRQTKRISSINGPFSPRVGGRPSLINIQNNVMENNNKKSRKHLPSYCEANQNNESLSNESNCLNATKKRRKKCDSKSLESNVSETSDNSSLSLRSSRRNRKQISYKEPSLGGKLRRPTD